MHFHGLSATHRCTFRVDKADRLLSIAESLGFWFAFAAFGRLNFLGAVLFLRPVDWSKQDLLFSRHKLEMPVSTQLSQLSQQRSLVTK